MSSFQELIHKLEELKGKQEELGLLMKNLKKEKKNDEAKEVAKSLGALKPQVTAVVQELTSSHDAEYKAYEVSKKSAAKPSKAKSSGDAAAAPTPYELADWRSSAFGVLPLHQSTERGTRTWHRVGELTSALAGSQVWVRARVQRVRKVSGKLAFATFRHMAYTVQAVIEERSGEVAVDRAVVRFAASVAAESIVDVLAEVVEPLEEVKGCTQTGVELRVIKLFVMSGSAAQMPVRIDDLSVPAPLIERQRAQLEAIDREVAQARERGDEAEVEALLRKKESAATLVDVDISTRLDNRVLDLRTSANQGILRIQSGIGTLFREILLRKGFTEIHSPKLIGVASEGGANVFPVRYFDTNAFLAQSPQLYKQMALSGDFDRVFEVGPVFRAENSNTHRHMTEFIGLDLEMAFYEHYHEVLDVLEDLMLSIFEGLEERYAAEIALVQAQFPFEPIKFKRPSPRLTYPEAIAMLREAGEEIGDFDDMSTPQEKKLGRLVKEKHGVDFYVIDKFPADVRPFYTMPDPKDPRYTNSYDIFLRAEEICSGAQRIHDPELLTERAKGKDVDPVTIQPYIDAFKYGAYPHAGGGFGLERLVLFYLNLGNIRRASLFPRDPSRLHP